MTFVHVQMAIRYVPDQGADEIAGLLQDHLHYEFKKLNSPNQLTVRALSSFSTPFRIQHKL